MGILSTIYIIENSYIYPIQEEYLELALSKQSLPFSFSLLHSFDFIFINYEKLFLKDDRLAKLEKLPLFFQILSDFKKKILSRLKSRIYSVYNTSISIFFESVFHKLFVKRLTPLLAKKYIQILIFLKNNDSEKHPQLLIDFFYKLKDFQLFQKPSFGKELMHLSDNIRTELLKDMLSLSSKFITTSENLSESFCLILIENAVDFAKVAFDKFEVDSKLNIKVSLFEISKTFLDQSNYALEQVHPLLESACLLLSCNQIIQSDFQSEDSGSNATLEETPDNKEKEELVGDSYLIEKIDSEFYQQFCRHCSTILTMAFSRQNFFASNAHSNIYIDHPIFPIKFTFIETLCDTINQLESSLENLLRSIPSSQLLKLSLQEIRHLLKDIEGFVEDLASQTFKTFKEDFEKFLFQIDGHIGSNNLNAKLDVESVWSERLVNALGRMKASRNKLGGMFWRKLVNLLTLQVQSSLVRFRKVTSFFSQIQKVWGTFSEDLFPQEFKQKVLEICN